MKHFHVIPHKEIKELEFFRSVLSVDTDIGDEDDTWIFTIYDNNQNDFNAIKELQNNFGYVQVEELHFDDADIFRMKKK